MEERPDWGVKEWDQETGVTLGNEKGLYGVRGGRYGVESTKEEDLQETGTESLW